MTIRAIVVDDEPLARQLIRELLAGETGVDVVAECVNGTEAIREISRHRPDLIFLDVQMPGMSGFDVIDRLDPERLPYVVFVTAFDRYAIRAFEVQAVDYLLKPFTKERFRESLDRARATIGERRLGRLARRLLSLAGEYALARSSGRAPETEASRHRSEFRVREGRTLRSIPTNEVRWIEAANQYVRLHATTGTHLLSRSLGRLQNELDPGFFHRIHRSTIVNASYVREVHADKQGGYSVVLDDGTALRLSRRRRHLIDDLIRRR